jgi:hypothetical protein
MELSDFFDVPGYNESFITGMFDAFNSVSETDVSRSDLEILSVTYCDATRSQRSGGEHVLASGDPVSVKFLIRIVVEKFGFSVSTTFSSVEDLMEEAVSSGALTTYLAKAYNSDDIVVLSIEQLAESGFENPQPVEDNDSEDDDELALYLTYAAVIGLVFLLMCVAFVCKRKKDDDTGKVYADQEAASSEVRSDINK